MISRRDYALLAAVSVASGFVGGLVSRFIPQRTLVAREFRAIDSRGNARVTLGVEADNEVSLCLRDPTGTMRAGLSAKAGGAVNFLMKGKDGEPRVRLSVVPCEYTEQGEVKARENCPRLELIGLDDGTRVDLGLEITGEAFLRLRGSTPKRPPQASVVVSRDGAAELRLQGSDPGVVFCAP